MVSQHAFDLKSRRRQACKISADVAGFARFSSNIESFIGFDSHRFDYIDDQAVGQSQDARSGA